MRFRVSAVLLLSACLIRAAQLPYFYIQSGDAGAWPAILSSIGFEPAKPEEARIVVIRNGGGESGDWAKRVAAGVILILEGDSPLAESFGFHRTGDTVRVSRVTDVHNPDLPVIWERGVDLPVFSMPSAAPVFARERWSGTPLEAGVRIGRGAVFWTATSPGERGYERYPYLLQALTDLGLEPPYRSSRLWAFFDSAYRSRVDLDYFAARWRKTGVSALQVAAWHFYEPSAEQDAYLKHLIEACHREGILVYAWLDMPHISEAFWHDHPEWREKTAMLQDAQLDWRKLMNLTNRDCFRSVASGVTQLVDRFDWDGINLAELYFESLDGMDNPARFTPMNDDVRSLFRNQAGFDPIELFRGRKDEASRRAFLDFRKVLARKMQAEWVEEVERIRQAKPDLDLVLTHVDDRFDEKVRDAIGADSAAVLPMLETHRFTFLVEDPATVWNLGPERYSAMAKRYQALTSHADRLAIDINVVERYQDVYPTKQQTGTELLQLIHAGASGFARVALYFENSLSAPDLPLLSAAAATVKHIEQKGDQLLVESSQPVGVTWRGPASVDGHPWPVWDGETVWVPAGTHSIERALSAEPQLRLTGDLLAARVVGSAEIEFQYASESRAIATFDHKIRTIRVDGQPFSWSRIGQNKVILPRGQHFVTTAFD